jgi:signal transduction histidine kinase
MRERAAAVGGTLIAGRRPSGGFEVTATLPTAPGDAT